MSQMQTNGGKSSKRKSDATATASSPAETAGTDDRAGRQRTDQMHREGATATTAAGAYTAAAAPSSSSTRLASSFLRLAVVERQLVMQGLDLCSLAQLASTCKQMRAEALDKEAGKFIPKPRWQGSLARECILLMRHSAHDSPLFRKHAAMSLRCYNESSDDDNESLIQKAAQFSRVVAFDADDSLSWTEERMLQLLSLPCMQHVTHLSIQKSPHWLDKPLVQTALFGLPRLDLFEMAVGSATKLLPSAVALASKLSTISVQVVSERCPSRSLRALRLAPALSSLTFGFSDEEAPPPLELVWSLPPTLTLLSLWNVEVPRHSSRPFLKTLFSRTPLLSSLYLNSVPVEVILRGLLDAGAAALPSLSDVTFERMWPGVLSVGDEPDLLLPIFRRFVHRFWQVTVRIDFADDAWDDPEELRAVQMRYVGWPSVELYWSDTGERIAGPPIPHPSDDDDSGSDVEVLEEPHAAEEH